MKSEPMHVRRKKFLVVRVTGQKKEGKIEKEMSERRERREKKVESKEKDRKLAETDVINYVERKTYIISLSKFSICECKKDIVSVSGFPIQFLV